MKNNKQELESKLLSEEQVEAVREMIVNSMRNVYTDSGSLPNDGFEQAAGVVADKIIHNTQKALLQSNVFSKVVKDSYDEYPVKNIYDDKKKKTIKKTVKKVVKKITKKVVKKGKK